MSGATMADTDKRSDGFLHGDLGTVADHRVILIGPTPECSTVLQPPHNWQP